MKRRTAVCRDSGLAEREEWGAIVRDDDNADAAEAHRRHELEEAPPSVGLARMLAMYVPNWPQ